jgi:hypothetical protein
LIEEAIAMPSESISTSLLRAEQMQTVALLAYALASCGRGKDAEARLDEALAGRKTLDNHGQASILFAVGKAWFALGDRAKARDALTLFPHGIIGFKTRKKMAELGEASSPSQ